MPEPLKSVPVEPPVRPEPVEPVDSRLLQANERTMLAWTRTGLAVMAFGYVLARLGLTSGPDDGSRWTAAAFAVMGAVINAVGIARYVSVEKALLARQATPAGGLSVLLPAVLMTVGGAAMLLYVLIAG